ncbi:hypothetical protein CHUAL_003574 [Chamberlinius hualienensis]
MGFFEFKVLIVILILIYSAKTNQIFQCNLTVKTTLRQHICKYNKDYRDCLKIGWLEDQNEYGIKTGVSDWCSNILNSTNCKPAKNALSAVDRSYIFIETFGNERSHFNTSCNVTLNGALPTSLTFKVFKCDDYFILRVVESKVSAINVSLILLFLVGLLHLFAQSKPF